MTRITATSSGPTTKARTIIAAISSSPTTSSSQIGRSSSGNYRMAHKFSTAVVVRGWIRRNFYYQVTAIDLSERFVELTQTRVRGASVRKMDMRFLDFPAATFDGLWASFSLLHIRAADVDQTLSGFKRVLRPAGLFFTAVHPGRTTQWVKTTISGMERDTYVQEWLQAEIEDRVTSAGFRILQCRPFIRTGGRYPLLSILARS
jgi:SAM-dependent methyltransferase